VRRNRKADYRKEVCGLFDPAEQGLEYGKLLGQQPLSGKIISRPN
jgi:hypothetical protein